ncbi:tetratricopeptide repeat-containing sensor histidine kinase [Winogradskyella sp.]|uniref:tetratricopeptide repeat-containing sensor histidine kinase n=1 Tax=Winogradskyella sp. TaxID=1883156 RepID=UPI003BA88AFE
MEKKKPLIVLMLCFLLISNFSRGQDASLESAVHNLKEKVKVSNGGAKLELLDSLCWLTRDKLEFQYDSIVKATITYAVELDSFNIANRQAARLIWSYANRLGRPKDGKAFFEYFDGLKLPVQNNGLLARFYLNAGDAYYFSEDAVKAIELYDVAATYALKQGDSILYGTSKKYIADAYIRSGKLAEASRMLQEVEALYLKTKDTIRLVNTKSSRADLYSMNGFYEEAKTERDEVIELAKKVNYESGLISALLNAAIDDSFNEHTEQTLDNLKLALIYARNSEEVKGRYEPQILIKLLQEYSKANYLDKAEETHVEIQSAPERYRTGYFEDAYHKSLGYYYFAKKDYAKALEFAQKHFDFQIQNNTVENIKSAHDLLYDIFEATGQSKLALYHYKKATILNDSLLSLKRSNALSYYQTLYETEKRDAKIASQESEITVLDAQNKVKQQWLVIGGIGLLAVFSFIYLIRARRFAMAKKSLQEQFSRDLINGQEEERLRLARELHDSVGQKLMLLSKTTRNSGNNNAEVLAKDTLEEVRTISRGLHPSNLERLGLTESINALVYNINANTELFFTEDIDNIDNILSKASELHLYRILQEVLSNIVKHSEAKAVKMAVKKTDGKINIVVSDNGKGFDFRAKYRHMSLGLKTLLERTKIIGGQINIDSNDYKGTTMILNIPI